MKTIFKLDITRNNKPFISMDNLNNSLDFSIQCTRSITYQAQVNEVIFANFPSPFLNEDVLIKKADDLDIITIQAGYTEGNKTFLKPFTTGQVAYYKGEYEGGTDFFKITFIETTLKAKNYFNYLDSTYNTKTLKKVNWLEAIQILYKDIDPASLTQPKLKGKRFNLTKQSLWDCFTLMTRDTGLGYYFANNILYLVDPQKPIKWFDLTSPYQIKTPAVLTETNPFRILENLNPVDKLQRIWNIETIFNPNIIPSVGVKCIDKYGNPKQGVVGKVTYSLNTLTGSNQITFLESVK